MDSGTALVRLLLDASELPWRDGNSELLAQRSIAGDFRAQVFT
jgi:hypothetical protein